MDRTVHETFGHSLVLPKISSLDITELPEEVQRISSLDEFATLHMYRPITGALWWNDARSESSFLPAVDEFFRDKNFVFMMHGKPAKLLAEQLSNAFDEAGFTAWNKEAANALHDDIIQILQCLIPNKDHIVDVLLKDPGVNPPAAIIHREGEFHAICTYYGPTTIIYSGKDLTSSEPLQQIRADAGYAIPVNSVLLSKGLTPHAAPKTSEERLTLIVRAVGL